MDKYKKFPLGIIGAGRAGAPIGRALENAGFNVHAISARSSESKIRAKKLLLNVAIQSEENILKTSKIVILALPDDELEKFVSTANENKLFANNQYVIHISGSKGLEVFENISAKIIPIAVHPAMTFTGSRYDVRRLVGATYGTTTNSKNGEQFVSYLIRELNGIEIPLTNEQRILYHAGLVHSANYLTTLIIESMEMLKIAGVNNPEIILQPLLKSTMENTLYKGEAALSGPIARGDVNVVKNHLQQIRKDTPEFLNVYKELGKATVEIARQSDFISEEEYNSFMIIFNSD